MTKRNGGFYNGGTESYNSCDDPVKAGLKKGTYYSFINKRDLGFQTNVELEGFPNMEFNSVWFDETVPSYDFKHYLATSKDFPVIGIRYTCNRWEDNSFWHTVRTSPITDCKRLSQHVFLVQTANSIYITEIHPTK